MSRARVARWLAAAVLAVPFAVGWLARATVFVVTFTIAAVLTGWREGPGGSAGGRAESAEPKRATPPPPPVRAQQPYEGVRIFAPRI